MRVRSVGRMLSLSGLLLFTLLAGSGCKSTSLARDGDLPKNALSELTWKPATNASSTASPDGGVRTTAFQSQETMPPVPELLIKDDAKPAKAVAAQPTSFHQQGRHFGAPSPQPAPLPNAPTEWSPVTLPSYVIRPPDVLLIELMPQFKRDENLKLKADNIGLLNQPVYGQHLVRPDGTVELGVYGPVLVAGRTLQQARDEVARVIHSRLDPKKASLEDVVGNLKVDVLTYNSSVYYVITDGAGLGQQVYRFPVTGHETVLDAISNINGLPVVSSPRRIWVARKNPGQPGPETILPVDWKSISEMGATNTNWQLMPGDRLFVQSDRMRLFNNTLGKFLEPVERMLGVTLLGSQAVNNIRNHSNSTNGNGN